MQICAGKLYRRSVRWREDDREGGGGGIGEDDDDVEAEETSPVREQSAHHQSFFSAFISSEKMYRTVSVSHHQCLHSTQVGMAEQIIKINHHLIEKKNIQLDFNIGSTGSDSCSGD